MVLYRKTASRLMAALSLVACIATMVGCGRQFLSTFLDLPAKQENSRVAPVAPALPMGAYLALEPADSIRPEIELTLDPDTVRAMLPRDHAGNVDWMAALEKGIINPRSSIDEKYRPLPNQFEFAFDFYYKGAAPMFDALFPHSSHTKWIDCAQCHPRIFPNRGTKVSMADIAQGKYCGECHGKVAFPYATGCERCHTTFPQPPDRANNDLIGTVQMKRYDPPAQTPDSTAAETADRTGRSIADVFPPAQFPHWVHRIRYKCKACHMDIFEPKAGANEIHMAEIKAGEKCGRCHNGQVAFPVEFANCERCHPPSSVASAPGQQ